MTVGEILIENVPTLEKMDLKRKERQQITKRDETKRKKEKKKFKFAKSFIEFDNTGFSGHV